MVRSFCFLILFCVLILFQGVFATNNTNAKVNLYANHFQEKDTLKKVVDTQKAKAKSFLGKIVKPLEALIKPFKFRANERVRIAKEIHAYIIKDSLAATQRSATVAKQIKGLTDSMIILQKHLKGVVTQTQLTKLLDSITTKQRQADSIATLKSTAQTPATDTLAKEKNAMPNVADINTSQVPKPQDIKTLQAKINLIRQLYKSNIIITDTSKNKDTVHIKKISLAHKAQVLGFYADTSHSGIKNFNFKTLTGMVYATNQIDGATKGELGDNIFAIDSARAAGCKIILSLYNNSPLSTSKFLNSNTAKNDLIQRAIKLIRQINGNGIDINFNGLSAHQKGYFVRFIASLRDAMSKYAASRKMPLTLSVTLPADDKGVAYDFVALDKYVTNFIIDFSSVGPTPGPLAPLNNGSNRSIETCFSLYLDQGVLPSKFILGVSYRGVVWQNTPEQFLHYIAYTNIRTNYSDATVIYNKGESAAQIEADYKNTYIDIWYDDEKTLDEKYDYVLNNMLGGVAIKSLGDDNGYGELQKELAYKFLKVDTTLVGRISIKHTFAKALANFIKLLTTNPCGQHIDSTYSKVLLLINLIIIVVILAGAGLLFYQVKKNGEAWVWRKKLIYALMGLFALWTVVFLMWLFLWDKNPFFGPSDGKANAGLCINISFIVLYVILILGILVGVLIRWIYQFNNNDDRP